MQRRTGKWELLWAKLAKPLVTNYAGCRTDIWLSSSPLILYFSNISLDVSGGSMKQILSPLHLKHTHAHTCSHWSCDAVMMYDICPPPDGFLEALKQKSIGLKVVLFSRWISNDVSVINEQWYHTTGLCLSERTHFLFHLNVSVLTAWQTLYIRDTVCITPWFMFTLKTDIPS